MKPTEEQLNVLAVKLAQAIQQDNASRNSGQFESVDKQTERESKVSQESLDQLSKAVADSIKASQPSQSQQTYTSNSSSEKYFDNIKGQESARIEKFMPVSQLKKIPYTSESLNEYYKQFIYKFVCNVNNLHVFYKDGKCDSNTVRTVEYLSNFHYIAIQGQTDGLDVVNYINTLSREFTRRAQIDRHSKSLPALAFAIKLLQAYDANNFPYDKVPSVNMCKTWMDQCNSELIPKPGEKASREQVYESSTYMNSNQQVKTEPDTTSTSDGDKPLNDNDGSMGDWSTDNSSSNANDDPEGFESYNDKDSYSSSYDAYEPSVQQFGEPCFTIDNSGNIKVTSTRPNQHVIAFSPEQIDKVNRRSVSRVERFKKMFRNSRGTTWQCQKRWELILDVIHGRFIDNNEVTRIGIYNNCIYAKNTRVNVEQLLDNEYDLDLYEIIDYRELFKKFKNIQLLLLDYPALEKVDQQFGTDADGIWALFQAEKSLQKVSIIQQGGDKTKDYTRKDFNSQADDADKTMKGIHFDRAFESMCARKNPNLEEKGPGYLLDNIGSGSAKKTREQKKLERKNRRPIGSKLAGNATGIKKAATFFGAGLAGSLFGPAGILIAGSIWLASSAYNRRHAYDRNAG